MDKLKKYIKTASENIASLAQFKKTMDKENQNYLVRQIVDEAEKLNSTTALKNLNSSIIKEIKNRRSEKSTSKRNRKDG